MYHSLPYFHCRESLGDSDDSADCEDEWQPSVWLKNILNMGSVPTFSIELPKRKLPTLLASTSTATKTPICQELKLTSTTLKAGGVQMGDISQSALTMYMQQRSAVRIAYLLTCLKNFVPFFYIHSKSLLTNH